MNALTRSKFDLAMTCIDRAKKEFEFHEREIAERPYWHSGHKGKTIRAIQMAQEMLQEIKSELRGSEHND